MISTGSRVTRAPPVTRSSSCGRNVRIFSSVSTITMSAGRCCARLNLRCVRTGAQAAVSGDGVHDGSVGETGLLGTQHNLVRHRLPVPLIGTGNEDRQPQRSTLHAHIHPLPRAFPGVSAEQPALSAGGPVVDRGLVAGTHQCCWGQPKLGTPQGSPRLVWPRRFDALRALAAGDVDDLPNALGHG